MRETAGETAGETACWETYLYYLNKLTCGKVTSRMSLSDAIVGSFPALSVSLSRHFGSLNVA